MKKISKEKQQLVTGGATFVQQCEGRMKTSPYYNHSVQIYGDGPTMELAVNAYNEELIRHKKSMPGYNHSAKHYNYE